ncbi:MAG TPA: YeeE/YedE thiosulfate transporter family protein [Candidatus Limiplasma sp.]|nr:YeeE/YedE thiosulfate transporter family protein [Candidatus Limiplasma sp.]
MSESATVPVQRTITRNTSKRRKKKNQLPIALGVLLLIIVIGILLSIFQSTTVGLFWVFGCTFGFILQKSRFCFTASLRDPCITGSTSITKAVLIAFALTSIGFTAIKYSAFAAGETIPGMSYVRPISLATVVGGIMFGIGMVIAGGCASGTLMRVGEGFMMQVLALAFFIIGSLWGAHDMGWWNLNVIADSPSVFLPDVFGWFGAIVIQLLIIACLYVAADLWERKKMGIKDEE